MAKKHFAEILPVLEKKLCPCAGACTELAEVWQKQPKPDNFILLKIKIR